MIALLQRVGEARVVVDGAIVGEIQRGLLVFVCAEPLDGLAEREKLLAKILKLRIFNDADGKMNHSVQNMDGLGLGTSVGGLLIVSQFTLAADASSGNRPGFSGAAKPEDGRRLYEDFVAHARLRHQHVQTGRFAADMKVHLVNDGPVTIPLRVSPAGARFNTDS